MKTKLELLSQLFSDSPKSIEDIRYQIEAYESAIVSMMNNKTANYNIKRVVDLYKNKIAEFRKELKFITDTLKKENLSEESYEDWVLLYESLVEYHSNDPDCLDIEQRDRLLASEIEALSARLDVV